MKSSLILLFTFLLFNITIILCTNYYILPLINGQPWFIVFYICNITLFSLSLLNILVKIIIGIRNNKTSLGVWFHLSILIINITLIVLLIFCIKHLANPIPTTYFIN